MFSPTLAISSFLLLVTFIYIILSIFFRSNNHSKDTRKRPPGPLALPIIGNIHLLGTLPHRNLQSLANKYGPIMSLWLGQVQAILVSSPEAAELFLKTHDPIFSSRPQSQATDYIFYGSQGMAFSEYGSCWRNMKKPCAQHLFSASKLKLFGPLRKEMVRTMVNSLETAATMGEVVNLSDKVNGLLEDMGLTRRLKETGKAIDQMLEKVIKEHEHASNNKDGKTQDFIDMLLSLMAHQTTKDGEQEYRIGRDNIKAIALVIMFGAYDTVSVTIEWTLSELLRNPKVMKNLQVEIQKVVGMNRMVEETDLVNLNYLIMVIKESLRPHPSGPFVPRGSVDVMVDGYYIQKKSRIIVNLWAIGRDSKIWSDNAHVFYQERFLNYNIDLQGNHFQLIPFGAGRRKCPGLQMGLTITKLVVAQCTASIGIFPVACHLVTWT